MDNHWSYLATGYGAWWLFEVVGFVLLPCYCYAVGYRDRNLALIRVAAPWTVLGIILNRFDVGLVAFNWRLPSADRYFPSFSEIVISLFVVTVGVLAFRFIATHMADSSRARRPGLKADTGTASTGAADNGVGLGAWAWR